MPLKLFKFHSFAKVISSSSSSINADTLLPLFSELSCKLSFSFFSFLYALYKTFTSSAVSPSGFKLSMVSEVSSITLPSFGCCASPRVEPAAASKYTPELSFSESMNFRSYFGFGASLIASSTNFLKSKYPSEGSFCFFFVSFSSSLSPVPKYEMPSPSSLSMVFFSG